jgi:hypothetical protein
LTFGTTRKVESSVVRANCTLLPGNSLVFISVRGWVNRTVLLNADRRIRSLEHFQGPHRESKPGSPVLWHNVSANCAPFDELHKPQSYSVRIFLQARFAFFRLSPSKFPDTLFYSMRDFRLPPRCSLGLHSSGMLLSVYVLTDVSGQPIGSSFKQT